MMAVGLPVVGTRRKANVGYECNATDRIFVSSKCPDGLVLPPELDGFVRRSFITMISRVGDGKKKRRRLTGDELFPPIDRYDG
jgi:hypothetical protein